MEPEVAMTTTSQAPNLPSDRDTQAALALGSSVSTMGVTTVAVYRSSDRHYGACMGQRNSGDDAEAATALTFGSNTGVNLSTVCYR